VQLFKHNLNRVLIKQWHSLFKKRKFKQW